MKMLRICDYACAALTERCAKGLAPGTRHRVYRRADHAAPGDRWLLWIAGRPFAGLPTARQIPQPCCTPACGYVPHRLQLHDTLHGHMAFVSHRLSCVALPCAHIMRSEPRTAPAQHALAAQCALSLAPCAHIHIHCVASARGAVACAATGSTRLVLLGPEQKHATEHLQVVSTLQHATECTGWLRI